MHRHEKHEGFSFTVWNLPLKCQSDYYFHPVAEVMLVIIDGKARKTPKTAGRTPNDTDVVEKSNQRVNIFSSYCERTLTSPHTKRTHTHTHIIYCYTAENFFWQLNLVPRSAVSRLCHFESSGLQLMVCLYVRKIEKILGVVCCTAFNKLNENFYIQQKIDSSFINFTLFRDIYHAPKLLVIVWLLCFYHQKSYWIN